MIEQSTRRELMAETRDCLRSMATDGIRQLRRQPRQTLREMYHWGARSRTSDPKGQLITAVCRPNFGAVWLDRDVRVDNVHLVTRRGPLGAAALWLSTHERLVTARFKNNYKHPCGYESMALSTQGKAYAPHEIVTAEGFEDPTRQLAVAGAIATALGASHHIDIGGERATDLFNRWRTYYELPATTEVPLWKYAFDPEWQPIPR